MLLIGFALLVGICVFCGLAVIAAAWLKGNQ